MHRPSCCLDGGLELQEVLVEMPQDATLNRAACGSQRLPVRPLCNRPGALFANRSGRISEIATELCVLQRLPRGGGEARRHAAARISARCAVRTPERSRDRAPPICMRHELSAAVHTSALVSRTLRTLSVSIADDVSAFLIAKVPPKPQHSVASESSTSSSPRTARRRR